jgi:clan AA aspartic protease
MIQGTVDRALDARISVTILSAHETQQSIEAIIDTGFNGFLTLPANLLNDLDAERIGYGRVILADGSEKLAPIYEVAILWDGHRTALEVDAADTEPLIGMALMEGYQLQIDVRESGVVNLTRLVP